MWSVLAAVAALASPPKLTAVAEGVDVGVVPAGEARWRVVRVDLRRAHLDLVGQRPPAPRTLDDLDRMLASEGRRRVAATNAGIFHPGYTPVGLHVEDGQTIVPLERDDGSGNFFPKPNAVFFLDDTGAHVVDAAKWEPTPGLRIATQSGPALVLDGAVHPRFVPGSTSLKLRSGVCASDPQTVWLFLSDGVVRFYDTARFARDVLGCADALYLDGTISGLWAEGLPDDRPTGSFAGFLVVTEGTGP